jgi:hypothetical protein
MKQSQKQGSSTQTSESRERSFNEGSFDNNVTLSQEQDPKDPTNDDERITNTEEQQVIDEDVEEQSTSVRDYQKGDPSRRRDDGDPEINTPVYTPQKTEDKIPEM